MGNVDVRLLLLAFDSPGSEVAGAFNLAERIPGLCGRKPIQAIADGRRRSV